jgi:hypothetical protein
VGYKKQRYALRLLSADAHARYNDVHVFFGGTGAVGGTALLEMICAYEELMALTPPHPDEVPILVATGRSALERRLLTKRLFKFMESRQGGDTTPQRFGSGYLTRSGVFVALSDFELAPLSITSTLTSSEKSERGAVLDAWFASRGVDATLESLRAAVAAIRPFGNFLRDYRTRFLSDRPEVRFRSITIGIPLPSLVAYQFEGLDLAGKLLGGAPSDIEMLKETFLGAVRDDLAEVRQSLAEAVLVAHTTSVGGMYDEVIAADGSPDRSIRLGFAHSAQDAALVKKQQFADELTALYERVNLKILITAAAIGIDEVRIRETIPRHRKVTQMLAEAKAGGWRLYDDDTTPITIVHPLTVALDGPAATPTDFRPPVNDKVLRAGRREHLLRPSHAIRSGENGFFTIANAEALYRVMRVASASELAVVLSTTALFGDDPNSPWFDEKGICYYTETDNSRHVFDFLAQPSLRRAQLSGLEPMALQDLGSAKHQGELHTLGLLILLHRLRTLDVDAIPPYIEQSRFDARTFFEQHSRALTFEDLDGWDLTATARDLAVLAGADSPDALEVLKPFRLRGHDSLFPDKAKARQEIFREVLRAVWTIPSLGSPIVFEQDGETRIRTGFFVAPLDILMTSSDAIDRWFRARLEATRNRCALEQLRDHHFCVSGFIDVRPHAILSTSRTDEADLGIHVRRANSDAELRAALAGVPPYGFFATTGLLATLFRLRALYSVCKEAVLELGTLQDFRWQMPRDSNGHLLVMPGVVEALRMVSEGLEKTTGTEVLDGWWGYERRNAPDRLADVLRLLPGHR